MNTWVRRSLNAGALSAGALLACGTAAHADTTLVSSDNTGILNGTQLYAPIQIPVDVCGNAVALLGTAGASCEGGATAVNKEWGWAHYQATSGNTGILNGTQIAAPIQIPVDVCGNALGVIGGAWAGCEGGATATNGGGHGHKNDRGGYGHRRESAETEGLPVVGSLGGLTNGLPLVGGMLSGGQGSSGLPLVGPLLSGLTGSNTNLPLVGSLGNLGDLGGFQTESTGGPATVINGGSGGGKGHPTPRPKPKPTPRPQHDCDEHGHGGRDVTMISSGNTGILNGTQIYAPIQIPVEVSSLAVGLLGTANAWSQGGSSADLG
ncbi:hypothetical protein F4553_004603 [Allocatelliglobosispora scoriae]|uniref:Chaplin domain-containing protein n=1 Tax=Allocatelliglobosispora scoriae TaxID=643052 RepID=A0A841BSM0_9ACTN|nr:chaplin family protein [Allocatelliglobosispora scoriae]MBB5871224.1 hypothetical protein [Allocatelliglobosispora scoriae]